MQALPIGRGIVRRKGHSIAILGFGSMVQMALDAADVLDASVADMRFIKPLDHELIHELASKHDLLVTVEENTISGGAGSAVNEWLLNNDFRISVLNLGLPDTFVAHGRVPDMLASVGLDKDGILVSIRAKLARTKLNTRAGGFPAGI
jgi:1-deoxy-D-xylulose-5-phosphate synthase